MAIQRLKYGIVEELNFFLNFNSSHIGQLRFRCYSTGNEGLIEAFNHVDNLKDSVESACSV